MSHRAILVSGLFASLFTTQIFAAEIKYDNYACYVSATHTIQHADGYLSGSFDGVLTIQGPESDPSYPMSAHCVGTFTVIGGEQEEKVAVSLLMQEGTSSLVSLPGKEIPQKSKELGDLCTVPGNLTALAVRASTRILALTRRPVQQTWGTAVIAGGVHTRSNKVL